MNWGLSDELKMIFPDVIPDKCVMEIPKIPSPDWIAGFTSAEGSFFVNIRESSASLLKKKVLLNFIITQHNNEEQLMKNLIEYSSCLFFFFGVVYLHGSLLIYLMVTWPSGKAVDCKSIIPSSTLGVTYKIKLKFN